MSERKYGSFEEFWPFYVSQHSKKPTRTLHFIGSTLALGAVAAAIVTRRPALLLGAPLAGYGAAVDIDVVHAWTWGPAASEFMVPDAPEQLAEAARSAVAGQVERALARRPADAPPVDVRPCAVEGDPAAVLVQAAASADALVLGRHGQSALSRRLVGPRRT